MLNVKKLQAIRDKILGVTVNERSYGHLNSVVYLQQILDAVQGVTSTPARVRGNQNEKVYLQKIRNAILGVPDGQFGGLSSSIYLQQIINAFNGVTSTKYGSLSENAYLDALVTASKPTSVPWYLSGGIALANVAAVWQPKGAASLAASYLRIAGDQGNANLDPIVVGKGVAPTWDAVNGWKGSATAFLATGVIEATNGSWSALCRFSSAPASGIAMGWTNTRHSWIYPNNGAAQHLYHHASAVANAVAVAKVSGVMGYRGAACYVDGVSDGTITQVAQVALEYYILGRNNAGVFATAFNGGYIQAVAIYKATITEAQIIAVTAAMNGL